MEMPTLWLEAGTWRAPGRLVRITELPFVFQERHAGESKLNTLVIYEFFLVLADKLVGRYSPVQFVIFSMVGCIGALLHLAVWG